MNNSVLVQFRFFGKSQPALQARVWFSICVNLDMPQQVVRGHKRRTAQVANLILDVQMPFLVRLARRAGGVNVAAYRALEGGFGTLWTMHIFLVLVHVVLSCKCHRADITGVWFFTCVRSFM